MGIFDKIKDAIFHRAEAAPKPAASAQPASGGAAPTAGTTPAATPPMTNATPSGSSPEPQVSDTLAPSVAGASTPAPSTAAPTTSQPNASASGVNASTGSNPAQGVDVAAILDKAVKDSGQKLDWRYSVVDTMKALGLDSSLSERKELAHELGYTGDTGDSATMNVWLQKALMRKLAENGGTVPADLRD